MSYTAPHTKWATVRQRENLLLVFTLYNIWYSRVMLCKPEARRLFKMIVVEVKLSEGKKTEQNKLE